MASAIEYGLVFSLVTVAAITIIGNPSEKTNKKQSSQVITSKPILKERDTNIVFASDYGKVLVDIESGCEYIASPAGITIRYRNDGSISCPNNKIRK